MNLAIRQSHLNVAVDLAESLGDPLRLAWVYWQQGLAEQTLLLLVDKAPETWAGPERPRA
ncbi:MAG: hypothetical protein LAT65_07565 [Saccharospirillum sp.]|nr:hypothetical protein [Saccharospirillum sp.]